MPRSPKVQPPSRPASDWDWTGARARCLREARRILWSPTEAEDAVQEAMLRAWSRRSTCRQAAAPMPWLLQITRHEALRIRERSGRRLEVDLDGEEVTVERGTDCVDATAERLDVQAALARLAAADRRLLEMRYLEDLTQPKLAELLDLPEGTVKVRLHRLRQRLRPTLESE